MDSCAECRVEVGFFSRRKVKRPDGTTAVVCKRCAARLEEEAAPPRTVAAERPPPGAPAQDPAVERLAARVVERFRDAEGLDLGKDAMAMTRIREGAALVLTKVQAGGATLELPFITADGRGPRHLKVQLTREDLG